MYAPTEKEMNEMSRYYDGTQLVPQDVVDAERPGQYIVCIVIQKTACEVRGNLHSLWEPDSTSPYLMLPVEIAQLLPTLAYIGELHKVAIFEGIVKQYTPEEILDEYTYEVLDNYRNNISLFSYDVEEFL